VVLKGGQVEKKVSEIVALSYMFKSWSCLLVKDGAPQHSSTKKGVGHFEELGREGIKGLP